MIVTPGVGLSPMPSGDGVSESGSEPAKEPRRRLLEPFPATPESRMRLDEIAAQNGTDPTAIIGFYQLEYQHFNLEQDIVNSYDWNLQFGVRWMFDGPLLPVRLF